MKDIENYFEYVFNPKSFEYSNIKKLLCSYCNLEGNSTEGYMCCYFSPEYKDYDLEYFGENNVLFDFQTPAVDQDIQIIITYAEFYEIVSKFYIKYSEEHENEKKEISELLNKLKINLELS